VATLTETNVRLVKQLDDNSNELQELKALIKKEKIEKTRPTQFQPITKKLLLDSQIKSFQHSHKFELQFPQTGAQARGH
jgi:hypothetical protein